MSRTRNNPGFIPSEPLARGRRGHSHPRDGHHRQGGTEGLRPRSPPARSQAGLETKALNSHPGFFLLPPANLN